MVQGVEAGLDPVPGSSRTGHQVTAHLSSPRVARTPAELARKLGRSQRLQIEVSPEGVAAALEVLQTGLEISNPEHEDGTLTIVGVEREVVPDVAAALVGAGVRIYRITPQEPSLEDVYFALHGEERVAS